MLTQNQLEQLERYMQGELQHDERLAWEDQLESDEMFRQVVEDYTDILIGLDALHLEQFEANLHTWEAKFQEETSSELAPTREITLPRTQSQVDPVVKTIPMANRWKRYTAVAAAVMALALPAGWYLTQNHTPADANALFADNFRADVLNEGELFLMLNRSADPLSTENTDSAQHAADNIAELPSVILEQGINAYNAQNYQEAIQQFNSFLKVGDTRPHSIPEVKFYLAVSYLASNQAGEAKTLLQELVNTNKNHTFGEEADWYLALTLLKLKETDNATKLLQQIADSSNNHAFQTKATTLLKKL